MEYVIDCVQSGWISSSGTFIERFEEAWAAECGRRFGVAVSNGTVALQLAVSALEIPRGSEIIMPSFTIMSCALAAVYNDCTPVLVDADPITWCMNVDQVEGKITSRTSAIMPVHIYGHPVDMNPVLNLAKTHGLKVIEDAAEAHGATYRTGGSEGDWAPCGSFGDTSTFSFYANKLVTTGEGGMIVTDDIKVADRARLLRNLAFGSGRRFLHDELGFNFRLTNLQAALGVAQIERFASIVEKKRQMGARYGELLQDFPGLQLPSQQEWARSVYWMYGVVLTEEVRFDAEVLAGRLRSAGIETRPFFLGLHRQPALLGRGLFQNEIYPVSDVLAERGLYLPSGLTLTESNQEEVAAAIRTALVA